MNVLYSEEMQLFVKAINGKIIEYTGDLSEAFRFIDESKIDAFFLKKNIVMSFEPKIKRDDRFIFGITKSSKDKSPKVIHLIFNKRRFCDNNSCSNYSMIFKDFEQIELLREKLINEGFHKKNWADIAVSSCDICKLRYSKKNGQPIEENVINFFKLKSYKEEIKEKQKKCLHKEIYWHDYFNENRCRSCGLFFK